MKSLIAGVAALAVASVAAPAFAQGLPTPTIYGDLGGSLVHDTDSSANLWAVQGRAGARFAKYFGAEGELAFGLGHDTVSGVELKLRHEYAGYVVGFVPVQPNLDVFARLGYGHQSIRGTAGSTSVVDGMDSLNYGAGAQYFVTPKDGVRAEYTRFDYRGSGNGGANVWSLSYVRKFN
jgi:opacity protein-like surface antigen